MWYPFKRLQENNHFTIKEVICQFFYLTQKFYFVKVALDQSLLTKRFFVIGYHKSYLSKSVVVIRYPVCHFLNIICTDIGIF